MIAAATPILSRIYSEEDFGNFAAILAIVAMIAPISTLKFDVAILLPEREADAKVVLNLSLITVIAISIISTIVFIPIGPLLFPEIWNKTTWAPIWIGAMVLITGVFTCLVAAALRSSKFGLVGIRSTIQSAGTSITQILLGSLGYASSGLLWGQLLGRSLGFIALIKAVRPLYLFPGGNSFLNQIKTYWKCPAILAPSAVLNSAGSQIPLLFIATSFGIEDAGQFGMAQRLAYVPSALLGAAMTQVFATKLANMLKNSSKETRNFYLIASLRILYLAVPLFLVLSFAAPLFMPILLGNNWCQSGLLVQALALPISIGIIVSPISIIYEVHQSFASLVMDISRILMLLIAIYLILLLKMDVVQAVWVFSIGLSIIYVITWIYGLTIASRNT